MENWFFKMIRSMLLLSVITGILISFDQAVTVPGPALRQITPSPGTSPDASPLEEPPSETVKCKFGNCAPGQVCCEKDGANDSVCCNEGFSCCVNKNGDRSCCKGTNFSTTCSSSESNPMIGKYVCCPDGYQNCDVFSVVKGKVEDLPLDELRDTSEEGRKTCASICADSKCGGGATDTDDMSPDDATETTLPIDCKLKEVCIGQAECPKSKIFDGMEVMMATERQTPAPVQQFTQKPSEGPLPGGGSGPNPAPSGGSPGGNGGGGNGGGGNGGSGNGGGGNGGGSNGGGGNGGGGNGGSGNGGGGNGGGSNGGGGNGGGGNGGGDNGGGDNGGGDNGGGDNGGGGNGGNGGGSPSEPTVSSDSSSPSAGPATSPDAPTPSVGPTTSLDSPSPSVGATASPGSPSGTGNNGTGNNGTPVASEAGGTPGGASPSPTQEEVVEDPESPANITPVESPVEDTVCFPGSSAIELESGIIKKMSELDVGDKVRVGVAEFSPVFMFTHKLQDITYQFQELNTSSGECIRSTPGHYLPLATGGLVAVSAIKIGDSLTLANGSITRVVSIKTVVDTGLYNPQTLHGNIAVNGIVASTFTRAVQPRIASVLLTPLRAAFRIFGISINALESGAPTLAAIVPSGALKAEL